MISMPKSLQALDILTEPPVLADTSELEKDAAHLRAVQLQIKKTSEDVQALKVRPLRVVPQLMDDTALLESHIRRLFSLAPRVEYSRLLKLVQPRLYRNRLAMHDLAFLAHLIAAAN